MMRLVSILLVGATLCMGAGVLNAQASASTGALAYNTGGNYLDEFYFDVDFGAGVASCDLSINATVTAPMTSTIEMWMTDTLSGLPVTVPSAANVPNYNWALNYNPTAGGSTGVVPVWGPNGLILPGSFPLTGIVRFNFTIRVAIASTFPNTLTVGWATSNGTIVPNTTFPQPIGTNMGYNFWTQVTAANPGLAGGWGRVSDSDYFQRNHSNVVWGASRFGNTTDELQFFIDVDLGAASTTLPVGLYAFPYTQAGSATGSCVVELYDMSAGWDTPVVSLTAVIGGTDAYGAYTTGTVTGLARFRVVMRGLNLQNVAYGATTLADFGFEVYFGRAAQAQTVTNDPVIAAPRMAITPAGTTISATTLLSCTGGSGAPSSYNWAIQGTPPAGVSLSSATGASVNLVVTGSPTGSATVRATNAAFSEFTEETYTFSGGGPVTPAVTVVATDPSAAEATPATATGAYTVTLSAAAASAVTVNFTMSGTAAVASGTDYNLSATGATLVYVAGPTGTLTFAAGVTSAVVTLTPVDDAAVESAETAIMTINTGTGYTVGATPAATVTIADNDTVGTPVITVSTTTNAGEPATNGTFTLTASPLPASTITVNINLGGTATGGGTDYNASATTSVQITTSGSATVTITVVDDLLVEGTETVTITLAAGTGYTVGTPGNASMNITDDDSAGSTLNITTTSLASGTVGTAYPATVSCTGGTGPYTWSIASGTLPTGLALGSSTTTTVGFTGTPSVANTFNFTIQVSDSTPVTPQSDTQALSITINAAGGGGGGVGGGGGGGGGGGCAADSDAAWMTLLGMLALMALAYRKRKARA